MAEIEEIPIEASEQTQNIQEIGQETEEIQGDIQDIQKKGRGRPAGAKNKPKPKPAPEPKAKNKPKAKAKRKQIPQPEYEDEYEEESEEEPQPPRRKARPPAIEVDRHALASEVLGLLQQQKYQRTDARRNHYASWFANM